MIAQWLRAFLTPCPWHLRRMGYLREQLAIAARYRRNRVAWDPHLTASRASILTAVERCRARRTVLVLGSGLLLDVPLTELVATFQTVLLVDVLHLPAAQRQAKALGSHVHCLTFDCTGVLHELWRRGRGLSDEAALGLFRQGRPPLAAGLFSELDLTVSVNLASQLAALPADWLMAGRRRPEGFALQLRRAAALRHVDWLGSLAGERLLIADRALVIRERDGREVGREGILGDDDLAAPSRTWVWRLAPIPEWDRHHHLELEVGVWRLTDRVRP